MVGSFLFFAEKNQNFLTLNFITFSLKKQGFFPQV